jgi:hypothetical protein
MYSWVIAIRLKGYIDSQIPSQTTWAPIFRSRRLNGGARIRVQDNAACQVNTADLECPPMIFMKTTKGSGPFPDFIIEFYDPGECPKEKTPGVHYVCTEPPGYSRMRVLKLREAQVMDDVSRALGLSQHRFQIDGRDIVAKDSKSGNHPPLGPASRPNRLQVGPPSDFPGLDPAKMLQVQPRSRLPGPARNDGSYSMAPRG